MSKIGERPIEIPTEVQVAKTDKQILIKGKEGEIELTLPSSIEIEKENNILRVKTSKSDKKGRSLHGLYRSLLANAVSGVQKSWQKKLEVVGTGYNVKMKGEDLELKVGYSHSVIFPKTEGIKYQVEENNKITVLGANKQLVGQIAYQIKSIKKPDAYKGKGIKYENEILRIKPGKKAKAEEEA